MTSNVGAGEIARNTPLGFSIGDDEAGMTYDDMKSRVTGELRKVFRPEFLNRIDEVIVFHKLAKDEIKQIVELLLKRIRESLADQELSLNLSDEAADLLVEKGWDPSMGARPLRRAIQRYIEDPLADEVLAQSLEPGSTVEVERADDAEGGQEVTVTVRKPTRERQAVGVGAQGGSGELPEGADEDNPTGDGDLPDADEITLDVPDAPPVEPDEDTGS